MASCATHSSLMLTPPTSSVHAQDLTPSLSSFNPQPLSRNFSLFPLRLKSRARISCKWIDVKLQKEADSRVSHVVLASFATEAKVAESGGLSAANAVTKPKTMKGMAALPTHIRHKLRLKRFIEIQRQRDMMTEYGLKSAMFMLTPADTKFLGKIKAHFRFNIDPKYYDQQLTATVNLPKGTGKSVKVAVLAQGLQLDEAKNAGADFVGGEDLIEQIKGGFMEFDKLIASPDMMPKVADLGMILRPRDLMPTVRNGTVTANILQAITEFKLGRIEYKADKTGTLHLPVGGADFSEEDIFMKFAAAVESMEANKPPGVQGVHWKSARLCASRRGHCVWLIMEELLDYKLPSDIKS